MSLNANKVPRTGGGSTQDPIEPGPYPGRVAQIIDFGLQPRKPFKGKEKSPAYTIYMTYELVDEFMVDEDGEVDEDKPRWISERLPLFSLEVENAKSTKRYNSLDPEGEFDGDFSYLAGLPCSVNVVQNVVDNHGSSKVYNNIASISPARKKDLSTFPELKKEPVVFTLDNPDLEVFESLPDWMKEVITGNLEFAGSELESLLNGGHDTPEPKENQEDGDKTVW